MTQAEDMVGLAGENAELRSTIRDTLWMACRYAHGRRSYAVSMFNDAARKAYALGAANRGAEPFAIDGDLTPEMSGLSAEEYAEALAWWGDPSSITNHISAAIRARAQNTGGGEA